ncbi:MAG: RNA-binding protein [Desulfovibrionaceae bacterium]|jgi:RNA recognition motif-containing protein|nr:RNA-binding protein [Desulfovibrionaceae bacterium]
MATKSLYVGNLPWSATEDEVRELFSNYGEVSSVNLISDRETGRARGFGFVEIAAEDAQNAVEALDNYSFNGRNLKVNEARPREAREPRAPRPYSSRY